MAEFPVLIVGGGPVGLTASIWLSQHGIRSLLVERHRARPSCRRRAASTCARMEMYDQCGIEAAIREAGLPHAHTGLIVWTKTLAGEEIERRVPGRATPKNLAMAVRCCNSLCAQDYLEPVLRRFAEAQGRASWLQRGDDALEPRPRVSDGSRILDRVTGDRDARGGRVRHRRRWRAEPHSPAARRPDDGQGGGVRQRQHPARGRPPAVDGRAARRPLLRESSPTCARPSSPSTPPIGGAS